LADPLTVRKEYNREAARQDLEYHHTQGLADAEAKIHRLESDHEDLCKELRSPLLVGELDKDRRRVLIEENDGIDAQVDFEKKVSANTVVFTLCL
jgi:hypothetical protein